MLYQGQSIQVDLLEEGIYQLLFDRQGDSVNKLDRSTLDELREALKALYSTQDLQGLILASAKESFIVGADINEFLGYFAMDDETLLATIMDLHTIFNQVEDLPVPTVSAINGLALGGGFEIVLATDYRVMSDSAKVGLPEVKLGIYPGWGGTVRLPRLIGVDNANEWICGGLEKRASNAFSDGAVDAVVEAEQVNSAALDLVKRCIVGEFDFLTRRAEKQNPIKLSQLEQMMAFESAKGVVAQKAGPHYPAPIAALKTMQKHANLKRDEALAVEAKGLLPIAKGDVCAALVGLYLKDHYVKKANQATEKGHALAEKTAVLGAGIMGGGIAYQSAYRGTPVVMKDISEKALQLGMQEATKLLNKRVSRGRMDTQKMVETLGLITPTTHYADFSSVDLVVEAVVEDPKIKQAVLAEVEQQVTEDTVITSNTSSISINLLASALARPENFCGMHFFNPVHQMPLVEVIRGNKSSEEAVARTVAYAKAMGKTPIVVNDCPGFLVNRILFPYIAGFIGLVAQGADFRQIDKVMEKYGWPMGPAYLLDVVGIDTAHHAAAVMSNGFPDRMKQVSKSVVDTLYELGRFGQKNGQGFYRYKVDKRGKPEKISDPELVEQIYGSAPKEQFSEQEIIERMMFPLYIETVRCLEESIVASPAEADMGLIYGLGFPPFRGGPLHSLEQIGLSQFCKQAENYQQLGALYQPTENMKQMAEKGQLFFRQGE